MVLSAHCLMAPQAALAFFKSPGEEGCRRDRLMNEVASSAHDFPGGAERNLSLPDGFCETSLLDSLENGMGENDPGGFADRVLPIVAIEAGIRFRGRKKPGSRRTSVHTVTPETEILISLASSGDVCRPLPPFADGVCNMPIVAWSAQGFRPHILSSKPFSAAPAIRMERMAGQTLRFRRVMVRPLTRFRRGEDMAGPALESRPFPLILLLVNRVAGCALGEGFSSGVLRGETV